jgi:hypothetical protein
MASSCGCGSCAGRGSRPALRGDITTSDGSPIAGAALEVLAAIDGASLGHAVSDAEGAWSFAQLPVGDVVFLRANLRGLVRTSGATALRRRMKPVVLVLEPAERRRGVSGDVGP